VLALEHVGGVPEGRCDAALRDLRILGENLLLCRPTRGELEQELDTETGAANTWLAVENLRIGDDQIFGDGLGVRTRSYLLDGSAMMPAIV
jgi:hypothetical protein